MTKASINVIYIWAAECFENESEGQTLPSLCVLPSMDIHITIAKVSAMKSPLFLFIRYTESKAR
jgi:hypothetical protein